MFELPKNGVLPLRIEAEALKCVVQVSSHPVFPFLSKIPKNNAPLSVKTKPSSPSTEKTHKTLILPPPQASAQLASPVRASSCLLSP